MDSHKTGLHQSYWHTVLNINEHNLGESKTRARKDEEAHQSSSFIKCATLIPILPRPTNCSAKSRGRSGLRQTNALQNGIELLLESYSSSQNIQTETRGSRYHEGHVGRHASMGNHPLQCTLNNYEPSFNIRNAVDSSTNVLEGISRFHANYYIQKPAFHCHMCSKLFKRNWDLHKHIEAVHLRIKPFSCSDCDSRFGHKGTRDKHYRTIHLKQHRFICEAIGCRRTFSEKGNMRKHYQSKHSKYLP